VRTAIVKIQTRHNTLQTYITHHMQAILRTGSIDTYISRGINGHARQIVGTEMHIPRFPVDHLQIITALL
jgi:hypothetical protein